jgi:hypothetical protein
MILVDDGDANAPDNEAIQDPSTLGKVVTEKTQSL